MRELIAHALLLASVSVAAAQTPNHPLDALTSREYWTVYDVLRASGRLDSTTRYASVSLREPPKAEVLAWKPGTPYAREALVTLAQGRKTIEAVVDIAGKKLESWREVPGVYSNLLRSDDHMVDDLMKHDSLVLAALRRRGLTDLTTIGCWPSAPGYFGTPEEAGRRLARASCQTFHGVYNPEARPIEGLVAVVDLDDRTILRVIDTGPVPVPSGPADFDEESLGARPDDRHPMRIELPDGPGFTVDGHEVGWEHWKLHFRIDPRRGVIVSLVRYHDGDRWRSVLYQGSLSEIFVPYQSPGEGWYMRTFLDAGENAAEGNGLPNTLEPGIDCPAYAVYFGMVNADEDGLPFQRARAACLFERAGGEIAWRHGDWQGVSGRPRRDLVLRWIATIGNYDYVFDWVFRQDGAIRVEAGATGSVEVAGAQSRTAAPAGSNAAPPQTTRDDAYGRFVADNTVAVNHDHFFSFRLDLDVDGSDNSFESAQLKTRLLPAGNPRRSIWVMDPHVARLERDAQISIRMESPALWRFINPAARGPMGYPTAYELVPEHNAMSLLSPDDWPQRRAGFTDHMLWVTPYRRDELYAAGLYASQSRGTDGLPAWAAANRPIENTDIVAWYTLGFHHVVRAEDWPVMPTTWHGFELRPFDFFARNPALDLPSRP